MNEHIDKNNPHRLLETEDIGPMLRKVSETSFDESRLSHNREQLFKQLSSLPKQRPLFSIAPRRRLAWAATFVFILASTAAAALIFNEIYNAPTTNDNAYDGDTTHDNNASHALKKRNNIDQQESNTSLIESEQDTAADDESAVLVNSTNKSRTILPKASTQEGTLEEQLKLFNAAKENLAAKDFRSALVQLDNLKKRYPNSPLSQESKELTVHALAGLHQYKNAAQTVTELIGTENSIRKKARLYRFLGDLQAKDKLCDKAVDSYRRALGLGLQGAEAEAAQAGIRACSP